MTIPFQLKLDSFWYFAAIVVETAYLINHAKRYCLVVSFDFTAFRCMPILVQFNCLLFEFLLTSFLGFLQILHKLIRVTCLTVEGLIEVRRSRLCVISDRVVVGALSRSVHSACKFLNLRGWELQTPGIPQWGTLRSIVNLDHMVTPASCGVEVPSSMHETSLVKRVCTFLFDLSWLHLPAMTVIKVLLIVVVLVTATLALCLSRKWHGGWQLSTFFVIPHGSILCDNLAIIIISLCGRSTCKFPL